MPGAGSLTNAAKTSIQARQAKPNATSQQFSAGDIHARRQTFKGNLLGSQFLAGLDFQSHECTWVELALKSEGRPRLALKLVALKLGTD
jgi:hypothetical protein